jgi:hypothetical protein
MPQLLRSDLLADFALAPTRSTSAEIDLFDRWIFGVGGRGGAWYVRHSSWGNYSNCDANRGRGDLLACLRVVRAWLADSTAPGMIVFLDKKQRWSAGRSPHALDSLVLSMVPRERIFTPAELRGGFASPREAAAAGAWPRIRDLRGRVAFVLTAPNPRLREYVARAGDGALEFVAPSVSSVKELDGKPVDFDAATGPSVVFYNFRFRRHALRLGREIRARRFFSRTWYPFDDAVLEGTHPCKFVLAGINRVAHFWSFRPFPTPEQCRRHPPDERKREMLHVREPQTP